MKYIIKNLWFRDETFNSVSEYSSQVEAYSALFAIIAGVPKKVSNEISKDGLVETWIIEHL